MAVVKNGTSRYDIKDYITNTVAPKYFSGITNMNDLTVGLFGYVTDVLADITNDTMFTISSLYKEIFPQLAELPESIYNHALIYQLSNTFAVPAEVGFNIVISEESILNNGTAGGNKTYQYFDIDSNMEFNIDSITFMLDYDIRIMSRKYTYTDESGSEITEWSHSAQYLMNKENDISNLTNPYIKSSTYINSNGKRYIVLAVKLHQVTKKTISDIILNNDTVNVVTLNYPFQDQLANFDIYYKAPNSTSYVQLKKQLTNSAKLDTAFCFYKLVDDNTLQITFSGDDSYFQPEYNSEIIVELYTTEGSAGNFESYDGEDVRVIGRYDKYPSNRGIIFMGTVTTGSLGGTDRKTIEELQNETIKAYSTVKSFSTTNDLNLYFNEIRSMSKMNSEILFMRKRDDVFERLYSAFILFRDSENNIVPTNTLDLKIKSSDIAYRFTQSGRNVIKAGKLFKYVHGSETSDPYGESVDLTINDDLDQFENTTEFIYINPFLTIINTNPLGVSFYLNSIDDSLSLTHRDITISTFYQFIATSIDIYRNALVGSDEYEFTIKFSPTTRLPREAFKLVNDDTLVEETDRTFVNETDGYTYIDNDNLKCIVEILNDSEERLMYINLELTKFDSEFYYYTAKIKTNDYLSSSHMIQIIEGFRDADTFSPIIENPKLIPTVGCHMNVYILYKDPTEDPATHVNNQFNRFEGLEGFTVTDLYYLDDTNLANFAVPVQEINSYVEYTVREAPGRYGYRIETVPLIKANYLKMEGTKNEFFKNFVAMYNYIEDALDQLTNNYSIDLKFFNTYGYSQHYFLVASDEHIDRVNISIKYKVKFSSSADKEEEREELIRFIKAKVEETKLSLTTSPAFYISNLTAACIENFPDLQFMDFQGINDYGPSIQSLESDVNEGNIIQGVIETSNTIPEYINIDFVIKDGEKTAQVYIELL